MKKLAKIGLVVGGVVAVGALACYGLKKLMEKTQCCGCCEEDCECGDAKLEGACDCGCDCHKTEAPAAQAEENVTEADFEKTE